LERRWLTHCSDAFRKREERERVESEEGEIVGKVTPSRVLRSFGKFEVEKEKNSLSFLALSLRREIMRRTKNDDFPRYILLIFAKERLKRGFPYLQN